MKNAHPAPAAQPDYGISAKAIAALIGVALVVTVGACWLVLHFTRASPTPIPTPKLATVAPAPMPPKVAQPTKPVLSSATMPAAPPTAPVDKVADERFAALAWPVFDALHRTRNDLDAHVTWDKDLSDGAAAWEKLDGRASDIDRKRPAYADLDTAMKGYLEVGRLYEERADLSVYGLGGVEAQNARFAKRQQEDLARAKANSVAIKRLIDENKSLDDELDRQSKAEIEASKERVRRGSRGGCRRP